MSKEEWQNLWSEFKPRISARKIIIIAAVFILITGVVVFLEFQKTATGKLIFVACNVGQGDAFYLKSPRGLDILIDGGPDESVLKCLSKNMPFWDRKLELVFQTHNHADHATGLNFVKKRYQIDRFFDNKTLFARDRIQTGDGVFISVLWPSANYQSDDQNNLSMVLKINDYLMTGDVPLINLQDQDLSSVKTLKVPHHGSRDSLDETVLRQMPNLKTAIISVGENSFGHPAPETIKMLTDFGIKVERTDRQ